MRDWSTQVCPAKLDFNTKFPAKYEVASLPLPTSKERQPPTWKVASKKKGPKLVQFSKGPMDDFITTTSGKPECQLEDELFKSLSDKEITQLDNAFLVG